MIENRHIRHYGRARGAQGMSLVEIMLTITILAILLAMAAPSVTSIVQNSRIRSQAGDMMANLAIARAEAVKRGVYVSLCPSSNWNVTPPSCTTGALTTSWNQGYIVFADANKDGNVDPGDTLIAVVEPFPGSALGTPPNAFTSSGFTNTPVNVLQFRPSGAANLPANGTFALCDTRSGPWGRTITISPTGRATSATRTCP